MRVLKKRKREYKKFSLQAIGTVRPILEYGSGCWDPCTEGQINASDRVQKKAAQFTYHTMDSEWESLAQSRTIARLCALFNPYRTNVENRVSS